MTNRGRHKSKSYPKEYQCLKDLKTFKEYFTPELARKLINNIRAHSRTKEVNLKEWEKCPSSMAAGRGFIWDLSPEGYAFWNTLISSYEKKILY